MATLSTFGDVLKKEKRKRFDPEKKLKMCRLLFLTVPTPKTEKRAPACPADRV